MTVAEIARLVGGNVQGEDKAEIHGIAGLETAGPDDLAFAEGDRSIASAAESHAGCIVVPEGVELAGKTTVAVARPKLAFVRAADALLPLPAAPAGIHATAIVHPEASVAPDASVGPHVVIGRGARVGAGTRVGAGSFVGENASLGERCVLYPRVTIYPGARIGNRVILHAGVVIGSDGFGYVMGDGQYEKFPQIGQVIIEDDVEIGSNSTVDRGALGATVIGRGTKIDNLVQVAHNVTIGSHCVIAAQTGISGSVQIGNYVIIAGQVGIADHVRVEDQAVLGAQAGIPTGKIIRKGVTVWGTPARPLDEFKRMYAHLSNLPDLARKVKELMQQMGSKKE
ncbi:MAG: UDP-3-O-(3-hydroxymyristoyl)glucosamine N-acyltransferase [Acidobacteria bacterium]|nr:UDP-3-O-(3-hydroxymyristoyl)glucosamine N-acyltransferase [Acidobacteriota bacterium]